MALVTNQQQQQKLNWKKITTDSNNIPAATTNQGRMWIRNERRGKWQALLHIALFDLIFHSWCKFPTATADSTNHNENHFYLFSFSLSVKFVLLSNNVCIFVVLCSMFFFCVWIDSWLSCFDVLSGQELCTPKSTQTNKFFGRKTIVYVTITCFHWLFHVP